MGSRCSYFDYSIRLVKPKTCTVIIIVQTVYIQSHCSQHNAIIQQSHGFNNIYITTVIITVTPRNSISWRPEQSRFARKFDLAVVHIMRSDCRLVIFRLQYTLSAIVTKNVTFQTYGSESRGVHRTERANEKPIIRYNDVRNP